MERQRALNGSAANEIEREKKGQSGLPRKVGFALNWLCCLISHLIPRSGFTTVKKQLATVTLFQLFKLTISFSCSRLQGSHFVTVHLNLNKQNIQLNRNKLVQSIPICHSPSSALIFFSLKTLVNTTFDKNPWHSTRSHYLDFRLYSETDFNIWAILNGPQAQKQTAYMDLLPLQP